MQELTVIIPSYNRASLLDKTLASLAAQTQRDFEVILVDHGSVDNTRAICGRYAHTLNLRYYWIPREGNDPGKPRDFGVKQAHTSLIAFLDCGFVVPPDYCSAHASFHTQHPNSVGLGMCHAHRPDTDSPPIEQTLAVLEQTGFEEQFFSSSAELCDERMGLNISKLQLPWIYGWTGNMSLHTADYLAVGGFDVQQGFGFEDMDLSYRLSKYRLTFAFVKGGWGVELPHLRLPWEERRELEYQGWKLSYSKYRGLGLEALGYSMFFAPELTPQVEEHVFYYLSRVGQLCAASPITSAIRVSHPCLLIGGTAQHVAYYDYVALGDERIVSTDVLWSCSGLLIPLDDNTLATVVVSELWRWLDCFPNSMGIPLLEQLLSEIKRTAQQAIFLYSSRISDVLDQEPVSIAKLEILCQRYALSFQIIKE